MSNPYAGLPDHRFWRRSVSRVEAHRLNPVVAPRFRIAREDRVATAGSCFAQHISRRLQGIDFNYFIPEAGETLSPEERTRRNFGVFSARFGNLYTTAQLLQLFHEAFGERQPLEKAWRRPDGRYVDAFRPQIEPDGHADAAGVAGERAVHLAAVRRMFREADVFIFTLGLTEAWRSRLDGSVFPIAPGVAAGAFDPHRYEAVNFTVAEVEADLAAFLDALKRINPGVRVLLTVSPVPLIATFEDRHVLTATTYSKAVLRVVADQVLRRYDWVDYFPSYEIITGSYAGGLYYEEDHREVNAIGVGHAMRCFLGNYVARDGMEAEAPAQPSQHPAPAGGIVCDEEMIDTIRA